MRCSAASKNALICAGVLYRVSGSVTCIVSTLRGSKPASTWRSAQQPPEHHAGAHQQHERQRHLADDQQRGACGGRRCRSLRPPSFSASLRSVRPARIAGSAPARIAGERSTSPTTNSSTRASIDDLVGARHLAGEQRRAGASGWRARAAGRRRRRPPRAPALRPAAAGTRARGRRRARRGSRAPCGGRARARTAGCRRWRTRSAAPARPRASSISSDVRTSPTISSCSGTTVAPQPVLACGYSRSSRCEIASISACACARSTPGFSRAITGSLWLSRTARSASVYASGTQMSRAVDAPRRDREARRHDADDRCRPRHRASACGRSRPALPPKWLFQNPSLRTTTCAARRASPPPAGTRGRAAAARADDVEEVRPRPRRRRPPRRCRRAGQRELTEPVQRHPLERAARRAASRRSSPPTPRSAGMPGNVALRRHVEQTAPARSGSSNGSGRSSTVLTMLKIAVLAPMPSASTATTAIANDGARSSTRRL